MAGWDDDEADVFGDDDMNPIAGRFGRASWECASAPAFFPHAFDVAAGQCSPLDGGLFGSDPFGDWVAW
ncbi:MAG: hypothetical protein HQL38_10840 [Alphaproteobacteria bacterium]|nr:hypothetical protein [Alphaproteobacteria bacterium]